MWSQGEKTASDFTQLCCWAWTDVYQTYTFCLTEVSAAVLFPHTRSSDIILMCVVWPDGLDPGVSLLCAGGTDGVGLVLPLHHSAVRLRFTRFDLLPSTVGVVQLQTVLGDIRTTFIDPSIDLTWVLRPPVRPLFNTIQHVSVERKHRILPVCEDMALLSQKGSQEGWCPWALYPADRWKRDGVSQVMYQEGKKGVAESKNVIAITKRRAQETQRITYCTNLWHFLIDTKNTFS